MTPVQLERFQVLSSSISNLCKQVRAESGLSQHDFAAKLGVTQAYISMIEKGNKTPSLETLFLMADLLLMNVEITLID